MDLNGLKKLLKRMESVNIRSKNFNVKWVKNITAVRHFVKDYERFIKPDREFEIYLEQYQKAKGKEKLKVKELFKGAIKRQREKMRKADEIFSRRPIELEEFSIDELPSNIDTKTMMLLYELDLIREGEDEHKNKN